MNATTATDRQIAFIKDLLHSRVVSDAQAERCRARLADGSFTKKLASDSITWFLAQPKLPAPPTKTFTMDTETFDALIQDREIAMDRTVAEAKMERDGFTDRAPVTEIGIYELGDKIFKVKRSKSDRLYAEVLSYTVGEALRLTAAGTVIKAKYVYSAGAIYTLSAADRITGDRAKELSVVFTSCIVCGRHLKNALSVERAIGPVCWKRV